MKIAFLSHLDLNLYLFRLPIMIALVKAGHEVYAICPEGEKFHRFQNFGITAIAYNIDRKNLNPLKELSTIFNIYKVLKPLKLDILQSFTAKPNIYGSFAGTFAHIPVICNAITGLGSFYISESKKSLFIRKIINTLYRLANQKATYVVFQNSDDMNYFISNQLVKKEKARLIISSGIDTEEFAPLKKPSAINTPVIILMIARAIWHKGIKEYYEAARILQHEDCEFILIGDTDEGNISCADKAFLMSGNVKWLGHREDIKEQIANCDIFVLPSYREGVPRTLLEAASMEKPIVTTDAIGCREVVDDEINGFLVPVKDSLSLANKIQVLIQDHTKRELFGKNGRIKAQKKFDTNIIVQQYLDLYQKGLS